MSQRRSRKPGFAAVVAATVAVMLVAASPALARPELPAVTGLTSPTHPSSDTWYSNASPSFSWTQSTLAPGYAFAVDQDAAGDPGTAVTAGAQVVSPASLFSAVTGFACSASCWSGHGLALADLNKDGALDAVVLDRSGNAVDVLDGDGSGAFGTQTTYALPSEEQLPDEEADYGPASVTIGDFNGDGWPDVAVALQTLYPGYLVVALNQGDGTLGDWTPYETGGDYPLDVVSADLNGDGHADLVVADNYYWTSRVGVLLGNGDGTFQSVVTYGTDWAPVQLAVGDIDGDGHPDVVTANSGSEEAGGTGSISVLLGAGDGTLATAQTTPLVARADSITLADLNADGDLDAVVGEDGYVSTLAGHGDGTFGTPHDVALTATAYGVAAGDLDRDGHLDVAAGTVDGVQLLLGAGDGTLGQPTTYDWDYDPAVTTADVNGDGRLDLVFDDLGADKLGVLPAAAPTETAVEGPLADGTWYFHVRSVDGDGDGGDVATLPVDIDTTAPVSAFGGLDDAWHSSSLYGVTVDVADPGYPQAAGVTKLELRALWGGAELIPWTVDEYPITDGAIHTTDSWEGLPDGDWTLELRATDAAGNVETPHDYTLKIDTTPPTVGLSGVTDGATYTGAQTAVLTATDPLPSPPSLGRARTHLGSLARPRSAHHLGAAAASASRLGEPSPQAASSGVASVSWRWGSSGAFTTVAGDSVQIPIGRTPAGLRTIQYYALDNAGNYSKETSFTVTVKPPKPKATGLNGVTVVRGGLAHLRYRMSDASFSRLSVHLYVTQYGVTKLGRSLGSQPVGQTLSVPLRVDLKPGTYTWRMKVVDAVGTSAWSKGRTLIVVARQLAR